MEIRALGLARRAPGILHGVTGRRPTRAGDCCSSALEEEEEEKEARASRRHGTGKQQESGELSISLLFFLFSCFFFPPLSFSHSLTLELVNSSGESARATQLERGSLRGRDPFFFLTRELR